MKQGRRIYRPPRRAIRSLERIWEMSDDQIDIRAEILAEQAEQAEKSDQRDFTRWDYTARFPDEIRDVDAAPRDLEQFLDFYHRYLQPHFLEFIAGLKKRNPHLDVSSNEELLKAFIRGFIKTPKESESQRHNPPVPWFQNYETIEGGRSYPFYCCGCFCRFLSKRYGVRAAPREAQAEEMQEMRETFL